MREIPVAPAREPVPVADVARLEAMCRLSMGAAHALNNAFQSVVGEAHLLHEDHKQDRHIVESCETILAQIHRCARITQALLTRRAPSQSSGAEVDMVRLVRELGALLRETLGSENQLELHFPDDLLMVDGDAAALETLVLTLVHYGADQAPGSAALELSVDPASGGCEVCLSLSVTGGEVPEQVVEAFVAPALATDALTRAQLEAVAGLVAAHGGRRMAERSGPGRWIARIALPALD